MSIIFTGKLARIVFRDGSSDDVVFAAFSEYTSWDGREWRYSHHEQRHDEDQPVPVYLPLPS